MSFAVRNGSVNIGYLPKKMNECKESTAQKSHWINKNAKRNSWCSRSAIIVYPRYFLGGDTNEENENRHISSSVIEGLYRIAVIHAIQNGE
jgi:hypothetical protein